MVAAGSFDAVYALNCLLHVPNDDLPGIAAVGQIDELIVPVDSALMQILTQAYGSAGWDSL